MRFICPFWLCTFAHDVPAPGQLIKLIHLFFFHVFFPQISIQLENTVGLSARLDHLHCGGSLHTDFILFVFVLLCWILLVDHFLRERHNKWFGCVDTGNRWATKWPTNKQNFPRNRRSLFECETVKWRKCEKPPKSNYTQFFYIFRMLVKFNQVYRLLPPGFILWSVSTICIELLLVQLELVELIFRFVAAIFFIELFLFPSFQTPSYANNRQKARISRI